MYKKIGDICNVDQDTIILDIMLPELDGFKVLEEIRFQKVLTPVLLLTARDKIEDRVKGLDLGADDYLVKPFAFSELFFNFVFFVLF